MKQAPHPSPLHNRLIAALPDPDQQVLLPHLEPVLHTVGETLYESSIPQQHAYFPADSIISVQYVMEDGHSAETVSVGSEGVLGVSVFMGGTSAPTRAVVHRTGHAFRIRAPILIQAFNGRRGIHDLLLRYTQTLIAQMCQTAVCNRHHCVLQQLSRWLLFSIDRVPDNHLVVTQEMIAGVLGVRREGITEAAGKLQKAGLIEYRRGHITVVDRAGLENQCCECYRVVRQEFDRLLPEPGRRLAHTRRRQMHHLHHG